MTENCEYFTARGLKRHSWICSTSCVQHVL